MKEMIDWQRMWNDDDNPRVFSPVKIIAGILSFFYLIVINARNWLFNHNIFRQRKLSCPLISVGNLSIGGTGKTPCVIMLAQMLKRNGFRPAVISRGYGGSSPNPYNVVSDGHKIFLDSQEAGDEPFLIAHTLQDVPVITGAKRIMTGQMAIDKFGADVLLCDDAMQHRQIFRDVNLVLLDSAGLKGNYHVLPRGKLREPIKEIRRASAIVFTRADEEMKIDAKIEALIKAEKIPVFQSIHKPEYFISGDGSVQKPLSELQGKKVSAFCGIANPDSFKKSLKSARVQLVSFDIFPDHHPYNDKDIEELKTKFVKSGAEYLMTTEKDAVRLRNQSAFLKSLLTLRVTMEIKLSEKSFQDFILEKIKHCQ